MTIRRHRGAAIADRLMRDALIVELQQDGETPDGERIAKIRLVARRLIDKAVDGEAAAIKEIFDRIDGRAGTAAEVAAPHTSRPWPTCASDMPISDIPEIGTLTHEETLDLLD